VYLGATPVMGTPEEMAVRFAEMRRLTMEFGGTVLADWRTIFEPRVVRTLDEADRLEPGEVLVCPMTMPAWTPLFGVAAAVVCDSGGPLSHCAIVARESMIPCVAGTVVETTVIPDGARIRVDGTTGPVHLLD